MPKIVFIGAGSGFGQRLCVDILAHEELRDSTISLVDINEKYLGAVTDYVAELIRRHDLPARVEATTERREVLDGADYVIISVAIGGPAYDGVPFYHEIAVPARYGVSQQVGDTVSVGAVFRMLRTGPEIIRMARDIEELCPQAWVLNYTNPMAMLCWAMNAAARVNVVGLCHSVQGTAHQLAGYLGVPSAEVNYWVAGINHMSWFLELKRGREDLYPRLREAADDPEIFARDAVRFEILKHFGTFVTESSGHMSEYVPYFRKNPDLVEAYHLSQRLPRESPETDRRWEWFQEIRQQLEDSDPGQGLHASGEYASYIIRAIETDEPFRFNGNVPNRGIITNLSPECCVEVPCLTDATGVRPCHVGELPPQLAALNMSNVAVQRLAVEAVLERSKERAYHAVALDPLSATQCSLPQLREMFEELWTADSPWLTEY